MDFGSSQKELLANAIDSKYKFIILPGAVRSGKTYISTLAFLIDACKRGGVYIVAGKSIGAVKRNILPELRKHVKELGGKLKENWSDSKASIGNVEFHFFGAVNEKSQDPLQGLTASGALLDEVVLFPKNFIEQVKARCSVEGSKIFMTCNPEGPRHSIKLEYIDRADEINAYVNHFRLDDNPSLSDETKDFYKTAFTGVYYERYIEGKWAVAEGAIFREYSVCRKPMGRYTNTYVGIDIGLSGTTAAICTAMQNGKDYTIDEYYYKIDDIKQTPITVGQHADNILKKFEKYKPQFYYIDPSATALYTEMRKRGIMTRLGDNDVLEGIRLMDVRFGKGTLLIDENCTNLLAELSEYRWDAKKQAIGIDAPIKENDHIIDALRYNIYTRYKMRNAMAVPITKPAGY